jgi:hypothetical protein
MGQIEQTNGTDGGVIQACAGHERAGKRIVAINDE